MDKYKCINDVFTFEQKKGFVSLPVKGEVYTLLQIVKGSKGEGYVFEELDNPTHPNGQPYSFRPSRFIPLDDISIDSLVNSEYLVND